MEPRLAWIPGLEWPAEKLQALDWEPAGDEHMRSTTEQVIPHDAGLFKSKIYLTNENYTAMRREGQN